MARLKRGIVIHLVVVLVTIAAEYGWPQDNFFMDNPATFNKFRVAKTYMYKGRQNFLKGKYEKAEKALNRCLKEFPQFADAYYYLALIYSSRKDYVQALQYIEKADVNFIFMDDLEVKARLRAGGYSRLDYVYRLNRAKKRSAYSACHGNILIKLKKYTGAEPHFLIAVRKNPKNRIAYHNLITLQTMLKKFTEAFHQLREAGFNRHKIDDKLRIRVVRNLVSLSGKIYTEKRYAEAYLLIKMTEGYQYPADPYLEGSLIEANKSILKELPAETHTLVTYIVKLYNERKYQKVLEKIDVAEAKGVKISGIVKNIVEQQLKMK